MTSPFDALDAMVSGAIEGAFGETVRFIPRASRRGAQYVVASADPDRSPIDFVAVPTDAAKFVDSRGQRTGSRMVSVTRIVAGRFELWVSAATVEASGLDIVTGDLVRLIERDGAPTFNVVDAVPEGAGDLRVVLSAEDQPE